MTEPAASPPLTSSPETKNAAQKKSAAARRWIAIRFFGALLLIAGAIVAVVEWRPAALPGASAHATVDLAPLAEKVAMLDQKTAALEARVTELAGRIDQAGTAKTAPPETGVGVSAAEIARLRADLDLLASGYGGLQANVKQLNESAAVTLRAARTSLAASMLFTQLQQQAEAGRGFAPLLASLRSVAAGDGSLQNLLAALEPYAAEGAPPLPLLQNEFSDLTAAAARQIDREGAQNWWQRILAELKNLISIRPLHGGDSMGSVLSSIENALQMNNVDGALEQTRSLPPSAQQVLARWQAQAEARRKIDATLQAIADHMAAGAQNVAPAPAPASGTGAP